MIVKHELYVRTQEKNIFESYGESEIEDPIMIYAQIPIEKQKYLEIEKTCKEYKISIYDLLENALENPIDAI